MGLGLEVGLGDGVVALEEDAVGDVVAERVPGSVGVDAVPVDPLAVELVAPLVVVPDVAVPVRGATGVAVRGALVAERAAPKGFANALLAVVGTSVGVLVVT